MKRGMNGEKRTGSKGRKTKRREAEARGCTGVTGHGEERREGWGGG